MSLNLSFGFSFPDLYDRAALSRLDGVFLDGLAKSDQALANRLLAARASPDTLEAKAESELLIALGPHLDSFLARLFKIEDAARKLAARGNELAPLYEVKRLFVQRVAVKKFKAEDAASFDPAALVSALGFPVAGPKDELIFATHVLAWQKSEAAHAAQLDTAARYAAWATFTAAGKERHGTGILFKVPHKVDPQQLVPVETVERDGVRMMRLPESTWRQREGFALTDPGVDLAHALDQMNYCIWCHAQGKDSCSKGLKDKKTGAFQKTVFNVTLAGCPLEEKISEMHSLKVQGHTLGAFAMILIDNPMVAGTGHRICNDCMKACIYQKQEPVDIPQAETRILKDVLELPWGFEIYSLLSRWNPLNLRRPLPKPATGRNVLIVGLGPAGVTLAHHLMNDGHAVVAVDGLKIEPLPEDISGVTPSGERVPFRPIVDIENELYENLDDRVMAGFGGVAEYGITVRWNKNFLKVLRLLIERRSQFAMYGGVRFGGTLSVDDAFQLGFDHIALCAGAGRPTHIDMPNGLARGVRMASDFLMALQLTGAAKSASIANLQLRLPVVVIGGGLTAIDTATESLAYYARQVEKFLKRYETLAQERGEPAIRAKWTDEDTDVAEEFMTHARAIRAERRAAAVEGRAPRIAQLLDSWGGATIAYRRRLIDSPSYTLNHEEVQKALEEGVRFAEGLTPVGIDVDDLGHAQAVKFSRDVPSSGEGGASEEVALPARAVLIAAGTQPNTVLAREDAGIRLDGKYFAAVDEDGKPVKPQPAISKPARADVLMQIRPDGRAISYFGDLHPSFFGNVVKAMGSAKQSYPVISRMLAKLGAVPSPLAGEARGRSANAPVERLPSERVGGSPNKEAPGDRFSAAGVSSRNADSRGRSSEGTPGARPVSFEDLRAQLDNQLRPVVHAVERLTPTIVEVVVRAPQAARAFRPGQFYRLQNFETLAPKVDGTTLAMEGLALTGAWVDKDQGLLSTIVLEMGGSSDLCALLKPGEPVVLMGPTGTPTETPGGETVVLVGGGLGNAVLFSIGAALRDAGSRVIYFAGYKKVQDRYKVAEIERAAEIVVWACDEEPGFAPTRPQDKRFVGNIVEAMIAYGSGKLGRVPLELRSADRIVAIGSDRMMAAVARARHGVLQPYLKPHHAAIASINSPMQCMMKEICAQCLQPHKDPLTGKTSVVFSCFNQDQPLDKVDFRALNERLGQNALHEKLTALWIDRCLKRLKLRAGAAA